MTTEIKEEEKVEEMMAAKAETETDKGPEEAPAADVTQGPDTSSLAEPVPAGPDTSAPADAAEPEAEADKTAGDTAEAPKEEQPVEPAADVSAAPVEKSAELMADSKMADESVDVKMETSASEEKVDEKVVDTTSVTETSANQAAPASENKEQAVEPKSAPVANNEPQPPKQQQQSTLPTRQYLDATVVPILHSALSQLAKVRPEDPIQFLGKFLLDHKGSFAPESK